ncbi:MAG: hypothetical protein RLZZ303_3608, partial [Candidatus Hydrogenedentota bacterium]
MKYQQHRAAGSTRDRKSPTPQQKHNGTQHEEVTEKFPKADRLAARPTALTTKRWRRPDITFWFSLLGRLALGGA